MAQQGQAQPQPAQPTEQDVVSRLSSYLGHEQLEADSEPEGAPAEEVEEQPQDQQEGEAAPEEGEDTVELDLDAPFMEITTKAEGGADDTRKWSLKEMRDGVMMKQDYQRKTAELARAREQMTQEVQKMIEPARNQYVQQLQFMQAAVQNLVLPELGNKDLEKLAAENPSEYVQLQARIHKAQQTFGILQQQIQNAHAQSAQEQAAYSKQMLADPIAGIPGWNDQVYSGLISNGAKEYGFAPEEVANVVDYRMIKVLNDALAYRKLAEAKPKISKQVVKTPKVVKPGSAGDTSDAQAQTDQKLRQRLRQTGDVKDAAAIYLQRMNRR